MSKTPTAPLNWIIVATSFGFVVSQLDVTIVNVALASMGTALPASVSGLQWVVDAYALLFASLLLSAGALGDRLGAKRVYIAGFVLFAMASLACGVAPNAAALVVARAVQGIGASALVPPSLALLAHACGDNAKVRARAIGLWTAAGGISIAAGPVTGGFLIGWFGWRSIFLVNLPLVAIGIALTMRYVPETPRNGRGRHLDLPGQALAILALIGLTGGTIEMGPRGWNDGLVQGSFAVGAAAAIVFMFVEARSGNPMLPLSFFRNRTFSSAVAVGILVNLSYYGTIFVLSLYLQQARGYGVLAAGLAFLPLTATFILSNVAAGALVGRFGSRLPMTAGFLLAAGGYLLLRILDEATPYWLMVPGFLLIPLGMGTGVPAMTTALLSSVERKFSGTASGVLNTARQAGGAVGVAAFGSLVGKAHEAIVPGLHAAVSISGGLLALAALISLIGIRGR
ncbi:MAG: Drug resistance transporter, EmrB/QacA subfamily [Rhodospirillales bacterium]|nr:Drug resistance transporter, EmrB/QacA subfamily [Rhodospirillales bacterium]